MTMIKVNLNNVRNLNSKLLTYKTDIQNISKEMMKSSEFFADDFYKQNHIEEKLVDIVKKIQIIEKNIDDLYKMVNYSMDEYSRTEFSLCQKWANIKE